MDEILILAIHKVTKEEYVREGSVRLCEILAEKLRSKGKRPYIIPVGGSNALGTWGYIDAIREVQEQCLDAFGSESYFTDLAMACGSGGTTAGIALGTHLSGVEQKVHAYAVCDDVDYFYSFIDGLIAGLYGSLSSDVQILSCRSLMRVVMAKGSGYTLSTREELECIKQVAEATGIILGRRILFFHTGGLFGLGDKEGQLMELINEQGSRVSRMNLNKSL